MNAVRAWIERHGYPFAVVCIAAATTIFYPGRAYFAKGQWALLYLPVIVLVASASGVTPALVAAILAFLSWNFFFLPPYHTFIIADPKDLISLFVFLLVGVAMGLQTGRMRARETQALIGEREATLLNRFSSHLVTEMNTAGLTDMLLGEIASTIGADKAALYLSDDEGEFACAGKSPALIAEPDETIDDLAAWVYERAKAIGLPADKSAMGEDAWPISVSHDEVSPGMTLTPTLSLEGRGGAELPLPSRERVGVRVNRRDILLPLQSASRVEGVLYVGPKRNAAQYDPHDARLLVSIVNQAAAFRERRRLQHVASRAEALHEADRLKSAFLSSISHELKTPLASVTATITGLLEEDVGWDTEMIRQELGAISEDLDRLNDSISALLDLSRLESDAWSPQREWYEIGDIVGSAVSKVPQKQRDRISFLVPSDLPPIHVDFRQWARALQNLLENALAYSDPDRAGVDRSIGG